MTDIAKLKRAVDTIETVVDLGNGKYAIKEDCDEVWYVTDADGLIAVLDYLDDEGVKDMRKHHEAKMPGWWRPTQRFAWRDAKGFIYFRPERAAAYNATLISADLNTGEEICACSSCEAEGKGPFADA